MKTGFAKMAIVLVLTGQATWNAPAGEPARAEPDSAPVQPSMVLKGHERGVISLVFRPDGKSLLSADSQGVRTWDLATGKETGPMLALPGRVIAFSRDGKTTAVNDRTEVVLHEIAAGKEVLRFDPHGEIPANFPFRPRVASMDFGPGGGQIATAASVARVGGPHGYPGGTVIIWDAASGRPLWRLGALSTGPSSVAFSADGKFVADGTNGAGGELPEPGEVLVWNATSGRPIHSLKVKPEVEQGEHASASEVAFSPDSKWIAATIGAGSRGRPVGLLIDEGPSFIRIWDMSSGKESMTLKGASLGTLAFSPDGKWLAAGGDSKTVQVWDLANAKTSQSLAVNASPVGAIAFSPDGSRLAIGTGGREQRGIIQIWSLKRE